MVSKFNALEPTISDSAFIADGAIIVGDVVLGDDVSVWYNSVIRGDIAKIEIGDRTNIQELSNIHCSNEQKTIIGKNVTIGHNCVIHSAIIGDNCLIGMGSVILDGAIIESGAMVAAGTVVPPGKIVPKNHLALGNPMKIVKELSDDVLGSNKENINHYIELKNKYKNQKK